jgi:hypothetical protein
MARSARRDDGYESGMAPGPDDQSRRVPLDEVEEVLDEKRREDRTTAREAFEQEMEEEGLSEEAGEVGDEMP